jgi:formamidopyrimidine-DNA glycosylase
MPELPEVQTVVTSLRPRVTGATLAAVRLNRSDIVSPAGVDLQALLTGRAVASIDRRAKRIVFTLDGGERFYVHLGMTGQLTVEAAGAEVRAHTHLVIELRSDGGSERRSDEGKMELRFRDPRRFGGVFWLGAESADRGLGPEPLTLRVGQLGKLLARTRRPIKAALLDQTMIAGIGNIYADEALFAAGVHPLRVANSLTGEEVARLNRAIKGVLRRAIRARGSTLRDFVDADNEPGGYRAKHRVYDREGETCRGCRSAVIERIVLTGRSTCFCPKCQRVG